MIPELPPAAHVVSEATPAADRKRILFVDDEPLVLQGIRRMLFQMEGVWDMTFVHSGAEALALLDREPFHVLITDMRMPGMTGEELLREVMHRHPNIIRIVLSGQSGLESLLGSAGPMHQYLSKPCEPAVLRDTIARACALSDSLTSDHRNLKQLISQMPSLPSLPALYQRITEAIQDPDTSTRAVGDLIAHDIGMSSKVLQLVNSAFFGLPRHISSPQQAVILLGLNTIKNLILSVQIFSQFDPARQRMPALNNLWAHSLTVARYARAIARTETTNRQALDDAFVGGLLHDAGKLVLAVNFPEEYEAVACRASAKRLRLYQAEREAFGMTHAQVGAYLFDLWALPDSIVTATRYHHQPASYGHLNGNVMVLTAVHVANALAHENEPLKRAGIAPLLDIAFVAAGRPATSLSRWRKLCADLDAPPEAR